MAILTFLKTGTGRALRVALGSVLVAVGIQDETLLGTLLVMVGLMPIVSGVANICLMEDLALVMGALGHHRPPALRPKP